ncbi:RING finger protein 112-like [Mustelus asterias]
MESPELTSAALEDISQELHCSICHDLYNDPISLQCGHNFCRQCIHQHSRSTHGGDRCPECRRPFNHNGLISDVRIRNVVSKIREAQRNKTQARGGELGEPWQLVTFDTKGSMQVDEGVLESCFLRDDVKDHPVCLLSIIGQERKGKSFLLNYLLRRLQNLVSKHRLGMSLTCLHLPPGLAESHWLSCLETIHISLTCV